MWQCSKQHGTPRTEPSEQSPPCFHHHSSLPLLLKNETPSPPHSRYHHPTDSNLLHQHGVRIMQTLFACVGKSHAKIPIFSREKSYSIEGQHSKRLLAFMLQMEKHLWRPLLTKSHSESGEIPMTRWACFMGQEVTIAHDQPTSLNYAMKSSEMVLAWNEDYQQMQRSPHSQARDAVHIVHTLSLSQQELQCSKMAINKPALKQFSRACKRRSLHQHSTACWPLGSLNATVPLTKLCFSNVRPASTVVQKYRNAHHVLSKCAAKLLMLFTSFVYPCFIQTLRKADEFC